MDEKDIDTSCVEVGPQLTVLLHKKMLQIRTEWKILRKFELECLKLDLKIRY